MIPMVASAAALPSGFFPWVLAAGGVRGDVGVAAGDQGGHRE